MKNQTAEPERGSPAAIAQDLDADTARALRLMADQYGETMLVDYDTVVDTIAEIQHGLTELEKRTPARWTTYDARLNCDRDGMAASAYTAKDAAKMVATQTALYEIRRQLGVALDEVSRDRAELDPYKVGNAYTIGGQS